VEIVRRALKGIFWSYATYVWQRLLTLATTAILARILVPEDFGLVAFAIIIMTLIEATRGFGINDALIYTSEHVEEAAETAFVINTVIGVAQFALAYLLAPLTLNFFDDARIVSILRVISFVFVIDGLGKTHEALLQKELKFRKSAIPEIIATAIKGIVSIVSRDGLWRVEYRLWAACGNSCPDDCEMVGITLATAFQLFVRTRSRSVAVWLPHHVICPAQCRA
jgi:O-antigen/teichoic acid export membrane protein